MIPTPSSSRRRRSRRSGTPPPCLPGPSHEQGERRWILHSYDVLRRRWKKMDKGEPILEIHRDKPIYTDKGVRNFYLGMKRAMECQNEHGFHGLLDSTNRLVPIQKTPIRGYSEILFDKCQSNEVDWNDYPFVLNSLIDGSPNVRIDDLISSLKFYKISKLEESERYLRNAAIRKIRKESNGEDQEEEEDVQECDLDELEQTELFVQSLIARACETFENGFIEHDPIPDSKTCARLSRERASSSNQKEG